MEQVTNPVICTHRDCGLIFNFGDARTTYEASATNKECKANCPLCGREVLYSEGFNVLLAEAPDEILAKLARALHQKKDRDQFETRVLIEFYKELGRRRVLELAEVEEDGTVRDLPTRYVPEQHSVSGL